MIKRIERLLKRAKYIEDMIREGVMIKKFYINKRYEIIEITEKDLIIACVSKNGKPYIRVFEDCVKNCQEIVGRTGEYKGDYYEIREVEFEIEGVYETRESNSSTKFGIKLWIIKEIRK